ncbi:hypothetical protein HanIR_Chr06g0266031 [Helianthus annuus]|nr:hypothetical protein HanIR_Chr06g0266031 [Helianthus annuus]KAJ0737099.1 hypothetical protein HanLR1_Chr06g0203221 [Helianthus annuus]
MFLLFFFFVPKSVFWSCWRLKVTKVIRGEKGVMSKIEMACLGVLRLLWS